MLIEDTQVPDAALPIAALRGHLRLGSGFAEETIQDGVLASFLRAAMAAIEGRTNKALILREFVLTLDDWSDASGQELPVSPVESVTAIDMVDSAGVVTPLAGNTFRLQQDGQAPRVLPVASCFPSPAHKGSVLIRFQAGFGSSFDDLPADLAQAVLLLAAHYYEYRDETALAEGCMPFGVTSLIARYRRVRVGFGA